MTEKRNKNFRVLDMYVRLCEGKYINKVEEAERFDIDERSVQRDIDDIRSFLDDRQTEGSSDTRQVVYDRNKKGFVMTGNEESLLTNSEILAVSKILLESRAFSKREISQILDKLIQGCVPWKNMKLVSDLIANEKYHYVELGFLQESAGKKNLDKIFQDTLWDLGVDIKEHNLLELTYRRGGVEQASAQNVKRIVEPVALMFSEYYFYLNAYIVEKDEHGDYVHRFDFPAIFRVDRIKSFRELGEKFQVTYTNRFEEGEFRKKVQFMYPGELMRIRFKYRGNNTEAVLDRLPTARILAEDEDGWLFEAQSYGKGILMWFLSQGKRVEIISPQSLREEMKQTLEDMLENYR